MRSVSPLPLHDHDQIAVPRQRRIGGKQPQRFGDRLCHQQPVEGILVPCRQRLHGQNMRRRDIQNPVASAFESLQGQRGGDRHVVSRQRVLDRELLGRGHADMNFIGSQDQVLCLGRQPGARRHRPEGDVRVQQQPHAQGAGPSSRR